MIEIRSSRKGTPVVRRSRNLRGIIRHIAEFAVDEVMVKECEDGKGVLHIGWHNGDWVNADFASFVVLREWVSSRRGLRGIPLYVNGKRSPERSAGR